MTSPTRDASGFSEISLRAMYQALLQHRRMLVIGVGLGGLLAAGPKLISKRVYRSTSTVVGVDPATAESRLAGIAGQLGFGDIAGARGGSLTPNPDLIAQMATSETILFRVLREPVPSPDDPSRTIPLQDLLVPLKGAAATDSVRILEQRTDAARLLGSKVVVTKNRLTNSSTIAVTTKWPTVSYLTVKAVVRQLNNHLLELRQAQAQEERRFSLDRIAERQRELRAAEDRVAEFLTANKTFRSSAVLTNEYERLQRQVSFQTQVLTAVTQSYEDAGVRSIRNTPVLIAIEPAMVPLYPVSRRLVATAAMGAFAGGLIAMLVILWRTRPRGSA